MRKISNAWLGSLSVAFALVLGIGAAGAGPAVTFPDIGVSGSGLGSPLKVGYRNAGDYHDDYDYYEHVPPSYYAPRVYGYVQRYGYGPPPPAVYPPLFFYDWGPPPRPASCGKYRYWDGEACVDARFRPPYVGPRW